MVVSMVREFSLEGLTIFYQGERWLAVSDTGLEATSERPLSLVTEGLDAESQAWGKSLDGQIQARISAEGGVAYQGQAPPEAIERMTAWGWAI